MGGHITVSNLYLYIGVLPGIYIDDTSFVNLQTYNTISDPGGSYSHDLKSKFKSTSTSFTLGDMVYYDESRSVVGSPNPPIDVSAGTLTTNFSL